MISRIIIGLSTVVLVGISLTGYFTYAHGQSLDLIAAHSELLKLNNVSLNEHIKSSEIVMNSKIAQYAAYNDFKRTDLQTTIDSNTMSFESQIENDNSQLNAVEADLTNLSKQVDSIVPGLEGDKIYTQAKRCVVQITNGVNTVGTGFICDTNGHIVTAAHVIEGLATINVVLSDGTVSNADIVGQAKCSDLALLKLVNPTKLAPAVVATPNSVNMGDYVLAIGHPAGLKNSMTLGVVSQLHRVANLGVWGRERWVSDLIQIDAPINVGQSGTPLFNQDGQVVGMVIARIHPLLGDGIAFAVSAASIKNAVGELLRWGYMYHPFIGIWVTGITPALAFEIQRESIEGALVIRMFEDGPAYKAGIRIGDVITAVDNMEVRDINDIFSYIGGQITLGKIVTVYYERNGQLKVADVKTYGEFKDMWWISLVSGPGVKEVPLPGL
jgi:S1-C subfamily serine protease